MTDIQKILDESCALEMAERIVELEKENNALKTERDDATRIGNLEGLKFRNTENERIELEKENAALKINIETAMEQGERFTKENNALKEENKKLNEENRKLSALVHLAYEINNQEEIKRSEGK